MTGEQRLARLETRAELADLVSRYSIAVDDRDLDTVVSLFLADGSFGATTGHAAIRAFYTERLTAVPYSIHYSHNHLLTEWGDDEVHGIVVAHAEMGQPEAPPLLAGMRYYDTYRRGDGGEWRFARRALRFFYMAPADRVVGGTLGPLRKHWPAPAVAADLPESVDTFKAFGG